MNKIFSKEMDSMGMNERIWQIREDLPGDALLSAKLVKAAFEKNWSEVEALLAEGADPRICRRGDAFGVESALFYALRDRRFDVAEKLYEAGDRLDDLVVEGEECLSSDVLEYLSFAMRHGDNYFYDESKSLAECCRCSSFVQIDKLIPTASREELGKAFENIVYSWIRYFKRFDVYSKIMENLLAHGAQITDEVKSELIAVMERRFGKCPAVLHPGAEVCEQVLELVKKA